MVIGKMNGCIGCNFLQLKLHLACMRPQLHCAQSQMSLCPTHSLSLLTLKSLRQFPIRNSLHRRFYFLNLNEPNINNNFYYICIIISFYLKISQVVTS